MLRWLSGRLSIQNFRRDLQHAQETLGLHEARKACFFLLRHIYAVKVINRLGEPAELAALENLQSAVLSSLPAGWFKRPGREMIAMALLDDWVTAKREVLAGAVDEDVFRLIDNELWQFAKDRLQPQEIEKLQVEAAEHLERKVVPTGGNTDVAPQANAEIRTRASQDTRRFLEADLG